MSQSILLLVNGSSNYAQNLLGKYLELNHGYHHINVDHIPNNYKLDEVIDRFKNNSSNFTVVTGLLHHVNMINGIIPKIPKAANIITIYLADTDIFPAYSYKYSFTLNHRSYDFYQKINEIHDSLVTRNSFKTSSGAAAIDILVAFAWGMTVGSVLYYVLI